MNAADLQRRAAAWRDEHYPDSTQAGVVAKLFEEGGELGRAVIGHLEGRAGRGDIGDEAAQVVLVLLSLVGKWNPRRLLLGPIPQLTERHNAATPLEVVGLLAETIGKIAEATRRNAPEHLTGHARQAVADVLALHAMFCRHRNLFADVEHELAAKELA